MLLIQIENKHFLKISFNSLIIWESDAENGSNEIDLQRFINSTGKKLICIATNKNHLYCCQCLQVTLSPYKNVSGLANRKLKLYPIEAGPPQR